MSRILIAWELGGGYGHLASLAPFAEQLIERGHDVHFALRDLSHAERMLAHLDCSLLQAPVRLQQQIGLRSASTYAELLAGIGYLETGALVGRLRAWRGLLNLVQPDVLIAEHAPTALLAARDLRLSRVMVGTGFSCPPPARPMPVLSGAATTPDASQLELEAKVLENVNNVLSRIGELPLEVLGDLYSVDQQHLCTFAELDPFAVDRTDESYSGPRGGGASGAEVRWPDRGRRRIFGYLKPEIPGFETLVQYLSTSPEAVLVHVPGMPPEFVRRFSSPSLTLSPEPVNVHTVAQECDGAICLAGHGTTCQLLLAGCPVLLAPSVMEQRLTAERIVAMGAGLMVHGNQRPPPYPSLIAQLLTETRLRTSAEAFAERHSDFDEKRSVVNSVLRVEDLIATAPAASLTNG